MRIARKVQKIIFWIFAKKFKKKIIFLRSQKNFFHAKNFRFFQKIIFWKVARIFQVICPLSKKFIFCIFCKNIFLHFSKIFFSKIKNWKIFFKKIHLCGGISVLDFLHRPPPFFLVPQKIFFEKIKINLCNFFKNMQGYMKETRRLRPESCTFAPLEKSFAAQMPCFRRKSGSIDADVHFLQKHGRPRPGPFIYRIVFALICIANIMR